MARTAIFSGFLSLCLLVAPLALTACSAGAQPASEESASGALDLPLTAVANGHIYRVQNVFVQVFGPTVTQLQSSSDPNETTLSTTLPTGSYTAILFNWSLERDDGSGNFVPVPSILVSAAAVAFSVYNGATTTVSYVFQTDGVLISVGAGSLGVRAVIDEVPAACTPFGSDCATGFWCPPTTLTGSGRACVPAGALGVGEPCLGPSECAANASCFDLGAGPVCAELCPPELFGAACDSGGTCQAASAEYGVCRLGGAAP